MNHSSLIQWLRDFTSLGQIEEAILSAIAEKLCSVDLPANSTLAVTGEFVSGLWILETGRLASPQPTAVPVDLLPGTVINAAALISGQPSTETVRTQTDCRCWFLSQSDFAQLRTTYPQLAPLFTQVLTQQIAKLSSQISVEQQRQQLLRPYLVNNARRGVIGKSRFAVRLRSQVIEAAKNREPVLIFGEPGQEKDNLAALIHFGSAQRRLPLIQVDCDKLQSNAAELFGRQAGKPGLLAAVGEGTVILNNVETLSASLTPVIAELLRTGQYRPVSREKNSVAAEVPFTGRLILVSEKIMAELDCLIHQRLKVAPLRVRKADIEDLVNYNLRLICRDQKRPPIKISQEALRQLQAYDFPDNLRELQALTERAMVQLHEGSELTPEVLWPSQGKKQQFRWNLLNAYPQLRKLLRSQWWPERINYGLTVALFAVVNVVLWVGPQSRSQNVALTVFWAWWWPLILVGYLFVGRLWCAFCPFMIYGELSQKLSLWVWPRTLKKWPRQSAERWGGWFLWGLFTLILLWEELWNLENTAYLSSCLLLLITAGAIICSLIFERRFWCRYLCPIGGMNGLFAKLSLIELRAEQGTCSAECSTYGCYKGSPVIGEGLATSGCPLYSHPAQLNDNRDCVLCMTCLKACPHRSVKLNLRPPGIELWTTHKPRPAEVALLFLLLDAVFLHRLPELQTQLGLPFDLGQFVSHGEFAIAALSLPALIPLLAYGIYRQWTMRSQQWKPRPLSELAYGYLPLVLGANLSHYLDLGLGEAGQIVPVGLATAGLEFLSAPVLVAHPAVINFLQGTVLIFCALLSIALTSKIARQPLKYIWAQQGGLLILTVILWTLIVP